MSSPPASSSGAGGSRRARFSRSPSGGVAPPSKRSKPSSSADAAYSSDQQRPYTSICVKNINPKIADLQVRELCNKKFSKYGSNTVKIYYKNQERVAFVNFTNCDDARKARHAKTGLVWENIQVVLEPVYYRRTVPAEQPITPGSPRDRSPASPKRRHRRPSPSPPPPPPPPPPMSSRARSPRHHRISSPPRSKRTYSPYIPLPPDLIDYVSKKASRKRNDSTSNSPSPVRQRRRRTPSKSKSPSKSRSRSASPSRGFQSRSKTDDLAHPHTESNVQHEPTRTLFVGNLEREIKESKIREIFGRYGIIQEVDLKLPQSSSKRAYAFIQYENMDMAFEARRAMDGRSIGKADCKIGYGKIVPTNCLWVGNIPMDVKRRDLEQAFARFGEIKTFNYSQGDPTAVVTYNEIEEAIKARAKMTGVIRLSDGQKSRVESGGSDSIRRAGFRIDYLDRPTDRRFVIVRPQEKQLKSRSSSISSAASDRSRSVSGEKKSKTDLKRVSSDSRSATPEKRRSSSPPVPGRTFYGPIGTYLPSNETKSINDINELMNLCERINRSTLTIYPVKFILKLHAYPARMHFLAGNPNLANQILGEPGDDKSTKTELKLTQRLRLDQRKFEELEKKICDDVKDALASSKSSPANRTKFSILFTSVNVAQSNGKTSSSDHNEKRSQSKKDTDDSSPLSTFISYLTSKEAAGVITIPFDSKNNENDSESAVLHIFPACQFTKRILSMICPSMNFSNGPHTPPSRPTTAINDEHLMLVIGHSD